MEICDDFHGKLELVDIGKDTLRSTSLGVFATPVLLVYYSGILIEKYGKFMSIDGIRCDLNRFLSRIK